MAAAAAAVTALPAQPAVAAADPSRWIAWPLPAASADPEAIAAGPDANLWVTETAAGAVLRLAPSGHAVEFKTGAGSAPVAIAAGPDGALWLADPGLGALARVTTNGAVSLVPLPPGVDPRGIVAGADGRIWFTERRAGRIGAVTMAGVVTAYALPLGLDPTAITAAGDGSLWFTAPAAGVIGHLTLAGQVSGLTPVPGGSGAGAASILVGATGGVWVALPGADGVAEYSGGAWTTFGLSSGTRPRGLALGGDGTSLWVTGAGSGKAVRIQPSLAYFDLPTASGGPAAITAGPDGNLWLTEIAANDVVELTLDVPGPPSTYHPVSPYRLFDTRSSGPLGSGATLKVQAAGSGPVPATGVTALVMNVTVTNPTSAGYLTVWPSASDRPLVSQLNFTPGQTVPNLVQVAVDSSGQVSFFNAFGTTDVVADVAGYYTAGSGPDGLYNPVPPSRILDTRGRVTLNPGAAYSFAVLGTGGVAPAGVAAVVLNVTVTNPTEAGFLTVWPFGEPKPPTSNLNFRPGDTVPNRVIVKVGSNGRVGLYNSAGYTDVVVDVDGWFTDAGSSAGGSRFVALKPARILDTRTGNGGYSAPLGSGASISVYAAYGAEFVPPYSSATPPKAIVGNLTATGATTAGFITAYPAGTNQPLASDLNFTAGETVPNQLVVEVSQTDGRFLLYNLAGAVDVIFDVTGYYC